MVDDSSTDDEQVPSSGSNPAPNPPPNPENTPRRRGRRRARPGRATFPPRFTPRDEGGSGSSSAAAGGLPEGLPILDSGNIAVAAAAGVVIGRSPSAGKRVREGSSSGGHSPVKCTICGKELKSPKALYGHMRAVHPGRTYVPPQVVLRVEERVQDQNQPDAAARGGASGAEEGEIVGGEAEPMEVEEPPRRLPDLNFPPPPDDV